MQLVLALNILATLEDALGESASKCAPRAFLAFVVACCGLALAICHTVTVSIWYMYRM